MTVLDTLKWQLSAVQFSPVCLDFEPGDEAGTIIFRFRFCHLNWFYVVFA